MRAFAHPVPAWAQFLDRVLALAPRVVRCAGGRTEIRFNWAWAERWLPAVAAWVRNRHYVTPRQWTMLREVESWCDEEGQQP